MSPAHKPMWELLPNSAFHQGVVQAKLRGAGLQASSPCGHKLLVSCDCSCVVRCATAHAFVFSFFCVMDTCKKLCPYRIPSQFPILCLRVVI